MSIPRNLGDNVFSSDKEVLDFINEHFCTISDKLASKLPTMDANSFKRYLQPSVLNTFVFQPVLEQEVQLELMKLKNSFSSGPDNIPSFVIKQCANVNSVCKALCYLFNISVEHGMFPSKLKMAKIIPLHKGGSTTDVNNYRPISLLNIFSKVFEKLIHCRLTSFLDKYKLISNNQFGFRKGHSSVHALMNVMELIYQNYFKKKYSLGLFLDISKAFDCCNHDILLHKLYNIGIRGTMLAWLKSYLTDRQQFTFCNSVASCNSYIRAGVPQGSVLGSLLFIIYVNDIFGSCEEPLFLFADDTNSFISSDNVDELFTKSNVVMSKIFDWCNANKLSINTSKTYFIIFKPNNQFLKLYSDQKYKININNTVIQRSFSIKFLGVLLDEHLTFKDHVHDMVLAVKRLIGITYRKRTLLPAPCLKMLFYSLVFSKINYALEIYCNTFKKILHPLIITVNQALRACQRKPFETPIKELYVSYNLLPLHCLFKLKLLSIAYSAISSNSALPLALRSIVQSNLGHHGHNTRASANLHVFNTLSNTPPCLPSNYMICCWNNLDAVIKSATTLHCFKTKSKTFLLNNCDLKSL
jgi:hypothetical protein